MVHVFLVHRSFFISYFHKFVTINMTDEAAQPDPSNLQLRLLDDLRIDLRCRQNMDASCPPWDRQTTPACVSLSYVLRKSCCHNDFSTSQNFYQHCIKAAPLGLPLSYISPFHCTIKLFIQGYITSFKRKKKGEKILPATGKCKKIQMCSTRVSRPVFWVEYTREWNR